MRSIGQVIRENMVLFLAGTAALASMIVVPPTAAYAGYINMPVLSVLFCLMVVIGGLRESGVFAAVLARLCSGWERCASWLPSSYFPASLSVCG